MSNIILEKEERMNEIEEIFEEIMANFSRSNKRYQSIYPKSSEDIRNKNKLQ